MKNKKFLLGAVVKIAFFCIITGFSTVCTMDLAVYAQKKESSIEGLFENFHFLSMKKKTACQNFSEDQRKDIRHCLDVGKKYSTLFLFNVATLPSELQQEIASKLLNKNTIQVQNFLEKPFWYSLTKYRASEKIMGGKLFTAFSHAASPTSGMLSESCRIDTIFELFDDIAIVDKLLPTAKKHVCNRKELSAFSRVLKSFPLIQKKNEDLWLRYTYRDAYTLSNLIKKINELQYLGFILFGIPCISAFIGQRFCTKVLDPYLVEKNMCSAVKNEALRAKFQETRELFWLKHGDKIVSPLKHSWFNYAKIIAPYTAMGPSCVFTLECFIRDNQSVREIAIRMLKSIKRERASQIAAVCIAAAGLLPFGFFEAIFYVMSWIALSWDLPVLESLCDSRLAVHGCILGAYVLGCLLYNVRGMSEIQNKGTRWKNIANVLNDKNIVIQ